eukprot:495206_1
MQSILSWTEPAPPVRSQSGRLSVGILPSGKDTGRVKSRDNAKKLTESSGVCSAMHSTKQPSYVSSFRPSRKYISGGMSTQASHLPSKKVFRERLAAKTSTQIPAKLVRSRKMFGKSASIAGLLRDDKSVKKSTGSSPSKRYNVNTESKPSDPESNVRPMRKVFHPFKSDPESAVSRRLSRRVLISTWSDAAGVSSDEKRALVTRGKVKVGGKPKDLTEIGMTGKTRAYTYPGKSRNRDGKTEYLKRNSKDKQILV